MTLLKELSLDENTMVVVTSDYGPKIAGGADSAFFNSAGPLRWLKCDVCEGGFQVPLISRWQPQIRAGVVSDHLSTLRNSMPTFAEVVGEKAPENIDGISFLPILPNTGGQK